MPVANLATLALAKINALALWFSQSGDEWNPLEMWRKMGWPARSVAIILLIMSAWSIGVMIDRWLVFSAARKQSREFAPNVGGALRENKLDEAIRIAERNKKSHLAKVVTSGLQEFQLHQQSPATPEERIEASKRALDRAEAVVHAELERGLGGLATIGSTAPLSVCWAPSSASLTPFGKLARAPLASPRSLPVFRKPWSLPLLACS